MGGDNPIDNYGIWTVVSGQLKVLGIVKHDYNDFPVILENRD